MSSITEILERVLGNRDFLSSDNFIEDDILDSLDTFALVEELEEEYGISLSGKDIVPENFLNVATITEMVKRYQ